MIDVLACPAPLLALRPCWAQRPTIVNRQPPQAGMRVPKHVSCETVTSMALEVIAMEGPEAPVSDPVARLIATCSRGWERFFADHDDQAPRFVPSVPERVFAVLAEVTRRQL